MSRIRKKSYLDIDFYMYFQCKFFKMCHIHHKIDNRKNSDIQNLFKFHMFLLRNISLKLVEKKCGVTELNFSKMRPTATSYCTKLGVDLKRSD